MARHSKADAARLLGISRTTLYRLIEQGKVSPTRDGLIDDTELVRVAPYVDTIKARIETSSNTDQERYGTSSDSMPGQIETSSDTMQSPHDSTSVYAPVDTSLQSSGQMVTRVDSVQERHTRGVTTRHWTDEDVRYRTHLEGEVDMLRAQVHTLQAQVERLQTELHETRIAREQAEEAARTERVRYVQMLQEYYQRYDRLLTAPVATAPTVAPVTSTAPLRPSTPAADRGEMRRRIVALLREHPEGLTPTQVRRHLGIDKSLASTMVAMRRDGLVRRVEVGRYAATD